MKTTITIVDTEPGTINCSVDFDPTITEETEMTDAIMATMIALEAIKTAANM